MKNSTILQLAAKHVALFTPDADGNLSAKVVAVTAKTAQLQVGDDLISVECSPGEAEKLKLGSNSVVKYTATGEFISVDNAKAIVKTQSVESNKSPRSPIWTRPNY